jgi:capsular polysaccharide biosynthesis protein
MSEQALDLRKSLHTVRRYKYLVGALAVAGLIGGVAYTEVHPAMLTSKAQVILSSSASRTIGTQVFVAGSYPVLAGAAPRVRPPVSEQTLHDRVQVSRLSSTVISIAGQGTTAAQAESIANSVARSYVAYVGGQGNPIVRVPASLVQPATTASGTPAALRLGVAGLLGLLVGGLLGAIIALVLGRSDRRLRERDEIADAIGIPVLAAVPAHHPADAAGWAKLLADYEPGVVQAWSLRKALHLLGLTDIRDGGGVSLAVVSLAGDRGALALGPQLASYAASLGVPTAFVLGPQQDVDATATLHTACAAAHADPSHRLGRLMVAVRDFDDGGQQLQAPLTVTSAVVDTQAPLLAGSIRTTITLLGVSAGAATAEQLARVAVSAASDGRQIAGIIVADPDPADHTSGRLPESAPPGHRRRATRPTGTTSESSW